LESAVEPKEREYIHQGLARRNIHIEIRLGEHVKIAGTYPPFMQNGLLVINLIREIPEAEMPKSFRVIEVDQRGSTIIEPEDPEVKG